MVSSSPANFGELVASLFVTDASAPQQHAAVPRPLCLVDELTVRLLAARRSRRVPREGSGGRSNVT
jgi:hypothetical protein